MLRYLGIGKLLEFDKSIGFMKRLSVVVPGYNTPQEWWERCVHSILSAIGPDDEAICVDDGSAVPFMVKKEWWPDPRVSVYVKDHAGPSAARNLGVEKAAGRFVAFVDSDDEIVPGVFERALSKLESTKTDIAIFGAKVVWTQEGLSKLDIPAEAISGRLLPADVIDLCNKCLFYFVWNKVFRKEFLQAHNLRFDEEGVPCEDIIFILDCVRAGATWSSVSCCGYVYYRTGGSLLSNYKKTNVQGLKKGAEAWSRYAAGLDEESSRLFSSRSTMGERQLLVSEWQNVWKPRSPYSIMQRWFWLKSHAELGGMTFFIKTAIYAFLRKHFYFRPVRRWNIRRQYPAAVEWLPAEPNK